MWALVVVTGVGPIATDSYIAALPALRSSLDTSAAAAQLTLTAFIIGMAVGQLAIGPASDGRGRRGLLLACTSAFLAASVACVVAPSAAVLVLARLLQGVAGGGGVAIGRAVVSDRFEGAAAAARYGTLSSIVFLGPVLAPAVGGVVLAAGGTWRTVFGLLALLGVAMVAAVLVGLPETLAPADRHDSGAAHAVRRMADLVRDPAFIKHVLVQCLATGGFFTYIGGSSFVLQTVYGISPSTYALVFATNATAMVATGLAFRALVGRAGAARLRTVGLLGSTAAAAGVLAVALTDRDATLPLAVPWVLLCVVVAGMGLCIPGTTALAQQAGRRAGGTASALTGGLTFVVGAAVTPLTGVLGYDSLLPLALLMTGFFAAASAWLLASGSNRA
jgi:DHA1 family bicyclomycin/chloramphenicol resistance-like MFS transporter